jgi:hypothetical protein
VGLGGIGCCLLVQAADIFKARLPSHGVDKVHATATRQHEDAINSSFTEELDDVI